MENTKTDCCVKKLSSIIIQTGETQNYDQRKAKWESDFKEPFPWRRWNAYVSGPWYEDSDPEGYGDTEQEAIDNAIKALRRVHQHINEFLTKVDNG